MNYLNQLNPQQKQAVAQEGAPLLILAGAGSGKTRVITTKIAYLILEKKLAPESILAVTFTNKAAGEMRERVADLVGSSDRLMIRTFHSFGAWLLRRYGERLGLTKQFIIYDDTDAFSLLKKTLEDKQTKRESGNNGQSGDELYGESFSKEDIKLYGYYIEQAKNKCLMPEDDLSSVTSNPAFRAVYQAYQSKLQAMGNADFGDLILRSVELLRNHPEVKETIEQRFKVILVDEYQDSNLAQFLLLKELYKPEANYLCVVGDEDQSIYGFRGAEVNNILDFPILFPGTEIIRLEENYRSTKTIIQAANAMIKHNVGRLGKNLWTANKQGDPITLAMLKDQRDEAMFCVQLLKDNAFEETAILYRNNYQSRTFEKLFTQYGIPYRVIGALRFYEREEVKDALAYLAFILNSRDIVSFMRIINKPARGLGKASIDKILESGEGELLEACTGALTRLKGKAAANLRAFIYFIKDARTMLDEKPLADFMNYLIHASGLFEYYELKDRAESTSRTLNLQEFVNSTLDYPPGKEGLARLLEDVMLAGTQENPFAHEGKVSLITVHNTKGLEFRRVIITGLEEGLFPYLRDTNFRDENELEEERRLFYVAMTRAREFLYLTSCCERSVYGMTRNCEPSRFLAEIPQTYIVREGSYSYQENSYTNQVEPPWSRSRQAGWDQEDAESGPSMQSDEDDEFADYYVGCGVYQNDYGTGVVVEKWFKNNMWHVKVNFFSGKKAQFILNYNKLERVSLE